MARAFTKESDNENLLDPLPEPIDVLPAGFKNYITPTGAARLKEALARLVNEDRPLALKAAGLHSDSLVKKKLGQIDQQIRILRDHIANFEIVDPSTQDPGRIAFGATVKVADEKGREQNYTICGIDEAEAEEGRISWISPLAKALRAKEQGDSVTIQLPGRKVVLELLSIKYV